MTGAYSTVRQHALGWVWTFSQGNRYFLITAAFEFPDEFVVWRATWDGELIPFDNVSSLWSAQKIVAEKLN